MLHELAVVQPDLLLEQCRHIRRVEREALGCPLKRAVCVVVLEVLQDGQRGSRRAAVLDLRFLVGDHEFRDEQHKEALHNVARHGAGTRPLAEQVLHVGAKAAVLLRGEEQGALVAHGELERIDEELRDDALPGKPAEHALDEVTRVHVEIEQDVVVAQGQDRMDRVVGEKQRLAFFQHDRVAVDHLPASSPIHIVELHAVVAVLGKALVAGVAFDAKERRRPRCEDLVRVERDVAHVAPADAPPLEGQVGKVLGILEVAALSLIDLEEPLELISACHAGAPIFPTCDLVNQHTCFGHIKSYFT